MQNSDLIKDDLQVSRIAQLNKKSSIIYEKIKDIMDTKPEKLDKFIVMLSTLGVLVIGATVAYENYIDDMRQEKKQLSSPAAETVEGSSVSLPYENSNEDYSYRGLSDMNMFEIEQWLKDKWKVEHEAAQKILDGSMMAGAAYDLDPILILSVMATESSFRPYVVSSVGAEGLMQVNAKWHQEKINDAENMTGDPIHDNIFVGANVLREYLDNSNGLEDALQKYNGARNDLTMKYAHKVLSQKENLEIGLGFAFDITQEQKITLSNRI